MDDKNIFYGPKISLPSTNNSDGTLTKDEVMSKGPRYLEISDEDMEELWNVLDADGDGAVTRQEFLRLERRVGRLWVEADRKKHLRQAREKAAHTAGSLFDDLDKDGDGTLSRDELVPAMPAYFQISEERANEVGACLKRKSEAAVNNRY
jgi:Ca2+-binding EF-hand superfamily protein